MISGFLLSKNMITYEKLLLFVAIAFALQGNSLYLQYPYAKRLKMT